MDISIIISGNLTGFSRFYASPNANDIYNEAKFDFDYRNFLTFLNAGEKAYAISFSPKVIAVSLITRILDSFRRPGILVVTALIPRYQLVSGNLNAQDKSAIYRLLNEINDKFYEKNSMNGMVNQNPAVLMQDYYSDILRNYMLVSDRMQKAINTTIDVNSPNKHVGYVSTSEKDMPKYLSSLMRKSYNGYHHVFFADKAPTNIDEPADEIVTYKVRVANDNRQIHGEVRLDDRIPTVLPQLGEIPIPNQNYTYRQVLNGDAGDEIIGSIENGTIVLTYRFQQEEKTVYFKFYDGANEVPLHVLRPLIQDSNGSSYPLSAESWTFRGEKIYGLKTIKSGNPEYTIEPHSIRLDLQPLREGATHNVYVSKGWTWTFDPMINNRRVNIKPISITLVNKYTREKKDIAHVTGYVSERLSGSAQEWEMHIESDYYKSATFPATGPYRLEPKPQSTPVNQNSTNGGHGTNVQHGGSGTRTHGNSGQQIKLSGGENESAKEQTRIEAEKKKRLIQYGIYAAVAIICCVGNWWGYTKLFPSQPDEPTPDNPIIATETSVTKNVSFRFKDYDGDNLSDATLQKLSVSVEPSSIVSKTDDGYIIRYDTSSNPPQKVKVNVSFQNINMLMKDFQNIFEIQSLDNIVDIPLSVKESEINMFDLLEVGINAKDYDGYHNKINGRGGIVDRNYDYGILLNQKLGNKPEVKEKKKIKEGKKDTKVVNNTKSDVPTDLDEIWLTVDHLKGKTGEQYKSPAAQARITTLRAILVGFGQSKVPSSDKNLSTEQARIVQELIAIKQKIDAVNNPDLSEKFNKQLAKKKSLKQVEDITRTGSYFNNHLK